MPRVRLSRALIVETAARLITESDAELTMARLGDALGADPSAVYRHVRDKDALMRAAGDHILAAVTVDLPPLSADWRGTVREICMRLRAAHIANPRLASLVRNGPPLNSNEFDLTERILGELRGAGVGEPDAVLAYHALIELTVGSAALDAALAAEPEAQRLREYERWRGEYRMLDPTTYPAAVAASEHMYRGTADDRFAYALDRLLDGIALGAGVAGSSALSRRPRRTSAAARRQPTR